MAPWSSSAFADAIWPVAPPPPFCVATDLM
jgi:hypothetical protein